MLFGVCMEVGETQSGILPPDRSFLKGFSFNVIKTMYAQGVVKPIYNVVVYGYLRLLVWCFRFWMQRECRS